MHACCKKPAIPRKLNPRKPAFQQKFIPSKYTGYMVPGHFSLPNSDPAAAAIASPSPTDNTPEYRHSFPTIHTDRDYYGQRVKQGVLEWAHLQYEVLSIRGHSGLTGGRGVIVWVVLPLCQHTMEWGTLALILHKATFAQHAPTEQHTDVVNTGYTSYIPQSLQKERWSWRQQRRGSRHLTIDRAQTHTLHSSGSTFSTTILRDCTSVVVSEGCLATTYSDDFNQTAFVDDWAHTTAPVAMDTNIQ